MDLIRPGEELLIALCQGLANLDDARILGKGYTGPSAQRGLKLFNDLRSWLLEFYGTAPPDRISSLANELRDLRKSLGTFFDTRRNGPPAQWLLPFSSGTTKACFLLAEFFLRTTGKQQPRRIAEILYKGRTLRDRTRGRRWRNNSAVARLEREYPRKLIERIAEELWKNPFQSSEQLAEVVKERPEAVDDIRWQLTEAKEVPDGKLLELSMMKRLERGIPHDPKSLGRGFLFESFWFVHIARETFVLPLDKEGHYMTISAEANDADREAAIEEYLKRPDCELTKPPKRMLGYINGNWGGSEIILEERLAREVERSKNLAAILRLSSFDFGMLCRRLAADEDISEGEGVPLSTLLAAFIRHYPGAVGSGVASVIPGKAGA